MTMKTNLVLATLMTAGMAMAQIVIPDGTKIRVRLEQNLSSESAELGATVDLATTQEVRVGDAVVIANGARVTGSIVTAQAKRRMGRGGKLDFTIERVQMVDGNWLSVRYTPMKNQGKGNGVATGVLTAGIAVVFLPAAPLGLLLKGHEATITKGRTYEVFADESTYVAAAPAASTPMMTRVMAQAPAMMVRQGNGAFANSTPPVMQNVSSVMNSVPVSNHPAGPDGAQGTPTTLNINANQSGADIEVDGMFVGNAPSTIQLAAGVHKIVVRLGSNVWQRDLQASGGTVSINAALSGQAPTQLAAR
jgi:hypothetical protein